MAAAKTTGAKKARRKSVGKKKATGRPTRTRSQKSKPDGNAPESTTPPEDETHAYDEQIDSYRQRMASVAGVLNEMFGALGESNPELWDRRAYLMIVALVYDRLVSDKSVLPTEELVTLSKVLAESRRAEAQSRKTHAAKDDTTDKESPSDELPENFAETVRQVYGTNFQMPDGGKGSREPGTKGSSEDPSRTRKDATISSPSQGED